MEILPILNKIKYNSIIQASVHVTAVVAIIVFALIEIRIPMISIFRDTKLELLLSNQKFSDAISSILSSIIAAYVFYIIVDWVPKRRKRRETKYVLNSLIASVLDAYRRERVFGHETAIQYVDRKCLEKLWLDAQIILLSKNESHYLALKFAVETADSRLEDFRNALPLAMQLSPERSLHWLMIIDKIRLLAEYYSNLPSIPQDSIHLINRNDESNPVQQFKANMNFRFLEIIEEVRIWLFSI